MLTGDYKHRDHGHNESKITLDMLKGYHILQSNATARRLTNADLPHIRQFTHLLLKINKDGKLIAGKEVLRQVGHRRRITIINDPTIETKTKPLAPKIVTTPDDGTEYDVGEASDEELAGMLLDIQTMTAHVHEEPKNSKEEHIGKISSSAQLVFKGKVAITGKNQEKHALENAQAELYMLQQESSAKARARQKKLQQKRAEKNEQDEIRAAEKNKEADKFDEKRAQIKKDALS